MAAHHYLAVDLGAESGRVIAGTLRDDGLRMEEVHRFPNGGVRAGRHLHWDVLRLFAEIKAGLRIARKSYGDVFDSIGVDTWGVDFALLDRDGALIGNPVCYRDPRTDGVMEEAIERLGRWRIFEASGGVQFMSINTLYQLFAMSRANAAQLDAARTFLMIPDLFAYWLTGRVGCEFTDATTTQAYNAVRGAWADDLLGALGIRTDIFPEVHPSGADLGPLLPHIAEEVGLSRARVIAPASHDTASAVVAVPSASDDVAWISSGTWSLVGALANRAFVTPEALEANISNYGGAGGAILPWKNINGLWLLQECRRAWARTGLDLSYDALTRLAETAGPSSASIDPDHASFLAPPDMPEAIRAYCRATGQPEPRTPGEFARAVLEGLAAKYAKTIGQLETLTGTRLRAVHIVGGGSRNTLLCRLTAEASGRSVIAGPVEATALGNLAMQAVGLGHLRDVAEARALIARTTRE